MVGAARGLHAPGSAPAQNTVFHGDTALGWEPACSSRGCPAPRPPFWSFGQNSRSFHSAEKLQKMLTAGFQVYDGFLPCVCWNHTDMKQFGCCWPGGLRQIRGDFAHAAPGAPGAAGGAVLDGTSPGDATAGAFLRPLFVPPNNEPASSGAVVSFSAASFLCKCCVSHEVACGGVRRDHPNCSVRPNQVRVFLLA